MTFVMFMTTMIMTVAILVVWGHNVLLAVAFFLVFGLIDASFLSAALSKFTHGGWFPIALSGEDMLHCHSRDTLFACMHKVLARSRLFTSDNAGSRWLHTSIPRLARHADTPLGLMGLYQIVLGEPHASYVRASLCAVLWVQLSCSTC